MVSPVKTTAHQWWYYYVHCLDKETRRMGQVFFFFPWCSPGWLCIGNPSQALELQTHTTILGCFVAQPGLELSYSGCKIRPQIHGNSPA